MCIKFEDMGFRKEKKILYIPADYKEFQDMMPKTFPGSPYLTYKEKR